MRQAEATITFTFDAREGYTKTLFEDFLKGALPFARNIVVNDFEIKSNPLREIRYLLRRGKKISAIKLARETWGTGLMESKKIVEAIQGDM
jgi:hypothetical protein